ncbi:unnamed protein product [Moneuplotes crassus]|uniref:Sulfotransferase domain-containing protein n=1 Tax=Euplotes crassus TaxID=5936 RepID=A0AAD1XF66_EUPCR|nr:unnamed protein product [Moneuplotes crassus]
MEPHGTRERVDDRLTEEDASQTYGEFDTDSVFNMSTLHNMSIYGDVDEECKFLDSDLQERNVTLLRQDDGKSSKYENFIVSKLCPTVETYLSQDKGLPKVYIKPKFLGRNCFEKVAIASYQGSGSSLLRKYIENITYILTGSDRDTSTVLGKQYQCDLGLEGEGVAGKKVWIVKTSFPEEIGEKQISIRKCILVCQNPCDAIFKHFCKIITKRIDDELSDELMDRLQECWEDFVHQEVHVWRKFYDYWMLASKIPTYCVRYEDLMEDPKTVLTDVFKFLLDADSIEGTVIEGLISKELCPEKELYYQREASGESFDKFTDAQMDLLKSKAGCVIRRLGYGSNFMSPINPIATTDYFENDELITESKKYELDTIVKNRDEHEIKVRYDYVELNKLALSQVKGRQQMDQSKLPIFKLNHESEKLRELGIKQCLRPYKLLIKEIAMTLF